MAQRILSRETMFSHPKIASLGNSIQVIDNLDAPINMNDEERGLYIRTPLKYSSTIAILMCKQGTISCRVGFEEYVMKSNDVLLMGNGVISELDDMSHDALFVSILVNDEFCRPYLGIMPSTLLIRKIASKPVCRLDVDTSMECYDLYRLIKKNIMNAEKKDMAEDIVRCETLSLIINICSCYLHQNETDGQDKESMSRTQFLYASFIELVKQDYKQERNIKYYAEQLGVTPRYLSQVVYKESGHHASEHIDSYVINEAKKMLLSHQYNVMQVSQELHFATISIFGRYFKKFTGMAPTQFISMMIK